MVHCKSIAIVLIQRRLSIRFRKCVEPFFGGAQRLCASQCPGAE
jgi:hypothetical protein